MTPDPLAVGGVPATTVNLTLTGDTIGLPAGGSVLDGSVGAGDVVLIFSLGLSGLADLDWTYAVTSPVTPTITAVGTIPGPDVDIAAGVAGNGGGLIVDSFVFGDSFDPFFLSFDASPVGAELVFGTLSGFIKFPAVTFVPEPSTTVLFAVAASCMAASRRRRV